MRHPFCRREETLSGYAKPVRFSVNASSPIPYRLPTIFPKEINNFQARGSPSYRQSMLRMLAFGPSQKLATFPAEDDAPSVANSHILRFFRR
jgi:hypothetical protein